MASTNKKQVQEVLPEIIEREPSAEELAEIAAEIAAQPSKDIERAQEYRRQAYQRISDPVFFQWQRGEATEEDYKAAVAQVQADYPIPGE